MTNEEMKNKWIANVCDYLANKTKGKNKYIYFYYHCIIIF